LQQALRGGGPASLPPGAVTATEGGGGGPVYQCRCACLPGSKLPCRLSLPLCAAGAGGQSGYCRSIGASHGGGPWHAHLAPRNRASPTPAARLILPLLHPRPPLLVSMSTGRLAVLRVRVRHLRVLRPCGRAKHPDLERSRRQRQADGLPHRRVPGVSLVRASLSAPVYVASSVRVKWGRRARAGPSSGAPQHRLRQRRQHPGQARRAQLRPARASDWRAGSSALQFVRPHTMRCGTTEAPSPCSADIPSLSPGFQLFPLLIGDWRA
jgi:hypothetical protein